jgi:hypothetical protein
MHLRMLKIVFLSIFFIIFNVRFVKCDNNFEYSNLIQRCAINQSDLTKAFSIIKSKDYRLVNINQVSNQTIKKSLLLLGYANKEMSYKTKNFYDVVFKNISIEKLFEMSHLRKSTINVAGQAGRQQVVNLATFIINNKNIVSYSNKIDILYELNNFQPIPYEETSLIIKDLMYNHLVQKNDFEFITLVYKPIVTDAMLLQQVRHNLYHNRYANAKHISLHIKSKSMVEISNTLIRFYEKYILYKQKNPKIPLEFIGSDEYIDLIILERIGNDSSIKNRYKILSRHNITINPDKWFSYQKYLARELSDSVDIKNRYDMAYAIITNNYNLSGDNYFSQHWLAGYISYLANDYEKSRYHFQECINNARSNTDLARAYYWHGMVMRGVAIYEDDSLESLKTASQYYTTFYGQLAIEELGLDLKKVIKDNIKFNHNIAIESKLSCENEVFLAFYLLNQIKGSYDYQCPYLNAFLLDKDTDFQTKVSAIGVIKKDFDENLYYSLSDRIIREDILLHDIVANNNLIYNLHPLVSAIVKKESNFNPKAVSYKGAMGMMQVMPPTAKELAKKLDIKYDSKKMLQDTQYNLTIGQAYITYLLNRYNNNKILTLAAYNAGPGSVDRWIEKNGDPRKFKNNFQIAEWIEKIPFLQTRHYVFKILNVEIMHEVFNEIVDN